MDQDYNNTGINKNICEAVGCFAKATDSIDVKVGDSRAITLFLCKKCMIRFEDN